MDTNNKETKNTPVVSGVQTYTDDMVKVIEGDKEGMIKKIIHEQEAEEQEQKKLSPESKKNKLFLIVGLTCTALALVAILFLFFNKNAQTIDIGVTNSEVPAIIFTDKVEQIEVSGLHKDKIAESVWTRVDTTLVKAGGVEGIYLTENKRIIGLRKFVALSEANFIPGNINFVNDNFLMGAVNKDTKDFFILIKMRSFLDIFEPMRAWENKMLLDLHGFFGLQITPQTNYLLTKDFEDGIVENKNARILYDQEGNIVLLYVFADEQSVVIADSLGAAHEVMLRLAASKVEK